MLTAAGGILAGIAHELTLFAAVAFLVGGASDTIIDAIWMGRAVWRRQVVFRRHTRADASSLAQPKAPGRIAIFVPAWDESAVIAAMLRHSVATLGAGDWVIYVGLYPNDPATADAVAAIAEPRVRVVTGTMAGPTTKADCLNSLWQRMCVDEARDGIPVKAIVLHDAEDVVHPSEVRVFDTLIERFDLVQLPVVPLVDGSSRWVGGHYLDEFATHHSKTLVAREAMGAGLPSAGVGCAFSRTMLGRLALGRNGPFDAASLTEDYELGLRIAELGGRAAFVRLPETPGGPPVCVRAHFPATLGTAITQKSRWIAGIALSGWDRLGWQGGVAECWMRIDDRRALFAALVVFAAYVALVLNAATMTLYVVFGIVSGPPPSASFSALLALSAVMLVWRLAMRRARRPDLRMARRRACHPARLRRQCDRHDGRAPCDRHLPALAARRDRAVGQDRTPFSRRPGKSAVTIALSPARPLRALGLVVGLWIVGRSAFIWLDAEALPVTAAISEPTPQQFASRPNASKNPILIDRPLNLATTTAKRRPVRPTSYRRSAAVSIGKHSRRENRSPMAPAAVAPAAQWPASPAATAAIMLPKSHAALESKAGSFVRTWFGSFWLAARDGSASGLAPGGGQLGGSQAGFRIYRHLTPTLAVTGRVSTALSTRQGEASIGLALRRGAFSVLAERRVALDSGGRNDWSLTAVAGVDDVALPLGLRLDGYAQVGIVGRDGFADGAVRVERTIIGTGTNRLSLGAGSWGSIQPSLARVDIGPQLVARTRLAGQPVRLSVEWRHRIAGNAQPGLGPVITLGADF